MSRFLPIAQQIGELVERKNAAYGSSFEKSGPALRLLFPAGATDRDALGESPYRDIAGYGILGAALHESRKESQNIERGSSRSELSKAVSVSGVHPAGGRRKTLLHDSAPHGRLESSAQKGRNKEVPGVRSEFRKEARAATQRNVGGRDGKSHQ